MQIAIMILEMSVAIPAPFNPILGNPMLPYISNQFSKMLSSKAPIVIIAEGFVIDNPSLNCLAATKINNGSVPAFNKCKNCDANLVTSSFCLNYLTNDRFGLFIEYFNFIRKADSREHGLDGGFTFLILPLIQADFSAGISLTDGKPNHFVSTGISFRVQ